MSQQKSVLGKGLASLLPGAGIPQRPATFDPGTPVTTQAPSVPEVTTQPTAPPMGAGAVAAGAPSAAASVAIQVATENANRDRHPGISLAMVDEIIANSYQPRRDFDLKALDELAQSIRVNGIIQPLVVRKTPQGYQLIAGERRLRAAKLAGLRQVPVVIRKSTDKEALELALIENIQRQDLNCVDEALAYHQLMEEFSLTQEETARRVGKERTTVANFLRLLKLPEAIIDDLKRQILSFGHGKALAGLEDNDLRLRARAQIVEKKLSVRETESLIEVLKRGTMPAEGKPGEQAGSTPLQSRLGNLSQELTRKFSTRVEIKGSDRRGKIVLHYATRQELDRILAAMQNG